MIFRMDVLDTTPGAGGEAAILAPPAEVTTEEQYLEWLRQAHLDPQLAQVMVCLGRAYKGNNIFKKPRIIGPMASTLDTALQSMSKWMYQKPMAGYARQTDGPPAVSLGVPPRSEAPLDLFQGQTL